MEQLHKMEKKLTMLRILELLDKPVRGAFVLQKEICSAMPCSFLGRQRRFLGS